MARAALRRVEIEKSISYIRSLLRELRGIGGTSPKPTSENNLKFTANTLAVSMIEGWRGEICHTAVTDDKGEIIHYKVKDPSFHNWMALALSLRGFGNL